MATAHSVINLDLISQYDIDIYEAYKTIYYF